MVKIELTPRARALRAASTDAERLLWGRLRNRRLNGWKWRRQAPLGPFVADFYCAAAGLIVELDGGQHAEDEAAAKDAGRTARLEREGLRVIRFWNGEVKGSLDDVCETILAACEGRL
jgi:very-short-patch-repair endonuclease